MTLVFDGAGAKWIGELASLEHPKHELLESLKGKVSGACRYCAAAFGVEEAIKARGIPLLSDYRHHPSIRGLIPAGCEIITF